MSDFRRGLMASSVQEPTEAPWYLSFTSAEGGSFSLRRAFYTIDSLGQTTYVYLGYEYRYNEGAWITTHSDNESFTEHQEYIVRFQLNPGEKVEFRSNVNVIMDSVNGTYPWCFFQADNDSGLFTVSGTPLSMINGDNKSTDMLYNQKYVFLPKFSYQTYYFTGLTRILNPDTFLLSTELAEGCYMSMFHGCTGLVNAPKLPATVMFKNCYNSMFRGCTSLAEAPELPATTLAYGCYELMFRSCSSLVKAPVLPAATLDTFCYSEMFAYCSKLNYIKMLAAPILTGTAPLAGWVSYVSSTGTFVKSKDATWNVTGNDGVPTGWTVITDDQESGGEITFYLDDTVEAPYEMKAASGMTWEQWVNSNFAPTEGVLRDFRTYNMGSYDTIKLYHELAGVEQFVYLTMGGAAMSVVSTEQIENGKTYYIS